MKITLITVCKNEGQILPFFFRHYDDIVDEYYIFDNESTDNSRTLINNHPKATLYTFSTLGFYREDILTHIRNDAYRNLHIESDWFIIVDIDELLYHKDGLRAHLQNCLNKGINIPKVRGYQMYSDALPEDDGKVQITEQIKVGVRLSHFDKLCITQKQIKMNYGEGSHVANPEGENIVYSDTDEVKLLHYSMASLEYRFKKQDDMKVSKKFIDRDLSSHQNRYHTVRDHREKINLNFTVLGDESESLIQEITESANKGNANDQYRLGMAYKIGHDLLVDDDKAIEWLTKAAESGHSEAAYQLGKIFIWDKNENSQENLNKGLQYLRDAASNNHIEAPFLLGYAIFNKSPSNQELLQEAVNAYVKACNEEHPLACHELGTMLLQGTHVPQDINTAIRLFNIACRFRHKSSHYALGALYYNGTDVPQDLKKAYYHLKQSADLGLIQGYDISKNMLMGDLGIPDDPGEAVDRFMEKLKIAIGEI